MIESAAAKLDHCVCIVGSRVYAKQIGSNRLRLFSATITQVYALAARLAQGTESTKMGGYPVCHN
jgi:hypothetical protein